MKIIIGLVLLTFLNTACGGQKNSKNKAPQTAGLTTFTQAIPALALHNQLERPEKWISVTGKEFVAVAKFARSDLSAFSLDTTEELISAGSLNAAWETTNYPETFAGKDPKPSVAKKIENYPETRTYLASSANHLNEVFLVVLPTDASQFVSVQKPTTLKFDYQMSCLQYLLKSNIEKNNIYGNYTKDYNGATVTCDSVSSCSVRANDQIKIPISIEEIKKDYPLSTCNHNGSLPAQIMTVLNTAEVKSYEVILNGQFKNVVGKLTF